MRAGLCAFLLACAAPLLAPAPARAEGVDLIGTWYVLIHYKDDGSPNPEQERWDDRVWVFASKGTRLSWTEYPIVVFDDEAGRFERRGTGQYARILHYWEPNASQQSDIVDGLQVNSRGSKSKTLRGSDAKGWTSGRSQGAASASVVTYEEVWSIEGMPTRPVFTRSDIMGGGRTDTLEGMTQYATTKIERGVLHGTFERDGNRHGSFRILRAGDVGALKGAKTQEERQRKAAQEAVFRSPQIRAQAKADLATGLEGIGIHSGDAELDALASQAIEWTVQGVPSETVQRRLGEKMIADYWSFAPRGAKHDDDARYAFPFDPATPRELLMGVGSDLDALAASHGPLSQFEHLARHTGYARHSFKFAMPRGTQVWAARAGEVVRVVDGFEPPPGSGLDLRGGNPNGVFVLHEDGSAAIYLHLAAGIPVRPGDRVEVGDPIGRSDTPGFLPRPLLHFGVVRVDDAGDPQSVAIRFSDGSADGVVPVAGSSYPAPTSGAGAGTGADG